MPQDAFITASGLFGIHEYACTNSSSCLSSKTASNKVDTASEVLVQSNTSQYQTVKESCKVLDTNLDGSYEGECVDGLAHGKGFAAGKKIANKPSADYRGEFLKGLPNGKGKYRFATGQRYDGDMLNGLMHGKGQYYFNIRWGVDARYVGDFKNGQMTGEGELIRDGGNNYTGSFLNGQYEGFGVNTYACGGSFWTGAVICTNRGIFKNGEFVASANSIADYEVKLAKEKAIESKYQSVLNNKDPQAMYLAAGAYEREGESGKATSVYEAVVSRFPKTTWGTKANDQLNAMRRSQQIQNAQQQRANEVAGQQRRQQEAQSDACKNNANATATACEAGCVGQSTKSRGWDGLSSDRKDCEAKCAQIRYSCR